MEIKDLFAKNLYRPINGVVKADQKDASVIWQELDEYVITKELDHHFRKFFETFLYAIDNANDPSVVGRIGIWISGFFGSGKSHFLKILSYLLGNIQAYDSATGRTKNAIDFFDTKVSDPMLLADLKRAAAEDTDVILFNIDSRADLQDGRGAILKVFLRVFNEMQGFSGDYPHIAELERYLTSKGKYEEFCAYFHEYSGERWIDERDAHALHQDEVVRALSQTLGQSLEAAEKWFDTAEDNLSLSIENFAQRVKSYLDAQGPQRRIMFLVDEVGQFIGGDGQLMLNLQTIAEDLGRICQGRAWVVVTSQEDIDSIIGDLKSTKANDFSKIQGRFTTRLSLSSSNTDEVIQARLLEKTPQAQTALRELFTRQGDILTNQLSFSHDSASLSTYRDPNEFVTNYPFAPFHFQLVQKVFESIRKAGATGLHLSRGERSMLDAFQSAAKKIAEHEVGALVPLYAFYPAIESFLDTAVKRTVDQAHSNPALDNPFDIHLLQTLFLIRYVDIIKPNIENLVTLFIQEVDADRLALKRQVEAGLERLEKQTLISRNGDLYFFLTNEERDVSREIKAVETSSSEETKLLAEILFEDVFKPAKQYRYKPYKRDYPYGRLLDGHPYQSKMDQELTVEVLSPLNSEYGAFNPMKCAAYTTEYYGRVLIKLNENEELPREVRKYLQTSSYIRQKSDASQSPSFKRILRDRQEENVERRTRLRDLLDQLVKDAEYMALGQTLEINASTPQAGLEAALEHVIRNLYNKFNYLEKLHDEPLHEIKSVLTATDVGQLELQKGMTTVNPKALQEVQEYIELMVAQNRTVLLHDLAEHFARRPYGWPEWETVLLVARLFMAGELTLMMSGGSLKPREAMEPLQKTAKWRQIKLLKRKTPSTEDMRKAQKLCQELFGKVGPESLSDLEKTLRTELGAWRDTFAQYQQLTQTGRYPGNTAVRDGLQQLDALLSIQDTYEFIRHFNQRTDDLRGTGEDLHTLQDFYTNQRAVWEKLQRSLAKFKANRAALIQDPNAQHSLKRLETIAAAEEPYGMLKEVEPLLTQLEEINDALLAQRREKALRAIDQDIERVKETLAPFASEADFQNQVLVPLQQMRRDVAAETTIPNISFHMEHRDEATEEALEQIEAHKRTNDPPDGPQPPPQTTATVKAAETSRKAYLESEADVEEFITALQKRLKDELSHCSRIRIQ